jgi:hypothetical protein
MLQQTVMLLHLSGFYVFQKIIILLHFSYTNFVAWGPAAEDCLKARAEGIPTSR